MLKWKIGTQVRAVLDLNALDVKKGDRGVVVTVDMADPVLPYEVAFGDNEQWMVPAWLEDA